MKRKILGILGVMIILGAGLVTQPAMATVEIPGDLPGGTTGGTGGSGGTGGAGGSGGDACGGQFLFFKPWHDGLCDKSTGEMKAVCEKKADECNALHGGASKYVSLTTFIWTIVLNVLFDLTAAIGCLAVAMVIYGGYLYIMSQGDPGKMAKGKKTLTTAITGVILGMGASVIVYTVKTILGIDYAQGATQSFALKDLNGVFSWAYSMAGLVAVIFIIKAGIDYAMAGGDPGKVSKATRSILYAVIGLIVVILAAAITSFVVGSVGGAL